MVNLDTGKLSVDGENWFPIERWETWFLTPFGVLQHLGPAVRACKNRDMEPDLTIVPVAVAFAGTIVEIIRR